MCPPNGFADRIVVAIPVSTSTPYDIVPFTEVSIAANRIASSALRPSILSHSIRVFLYAKTLAAHLGFAGIEEGKLDLLFTTCILHDIGTTKECDGPKHYSISFEDAHKVWVAIALHTSPGIAERISDLAKLVRKAMPIDFGGFEERYPRLEIEKVLGDTAIEQAIRRSPKASAASWSNNLYQAYLADPESKGVNKGF
ncbi:hypothetical protein CC78DRAFT_552760 [Lojkania enalia]|uniref:HD/PDEase domain-containing protein n=1 Tax=Lojkania enalia TaxID=147567 RepID=A0A9P4KDC1_9PLEO|nr:hypothetical protein CC78DRAFT_552760 [Didymosphaeria enalia]